MINDVPASVTTSPRTAADPEWVTVVLVTFVIEGGEFVVSQLSGEPLVQVSKLAFGICANKGIAKLRRRAKHSSKNLFIDGTPEW
jgi:hypothetical protein